MKLVDVCLVEFFVTENPKTVSKVVKSENIFIHLINEGELLRFFFEKIFAIRIIEFKEMLCNLSFLKVLPRCKR